MDLLVKFFVANSISNLQRFVSVFKSVANLHQIYIRSVTDPLPYHTIPYHTIPYHTVSYRTVPRYRGTTVPHRTVPYHIPYHYCSDEQFSQYVPDVSQSKLVLLVVTASRTVHGSIFQYFL